MSATWVEEDRGFDTPCWIWQGSLNNQGYAWMTRGGRNWLGHRFFYTEKHGPIPEGKVLDHLCRVSACVNPEHCEPVTQAVNTQRGRVSKFTSDQVAMMRTMRKHGSTYAVIAREFSTDRSTARKIVLGQRWPVAA